LGGNAIPAGTGPAVAAAATVPSSSTSSTAL
jgi:hypothetical protein